MDSPETQLPVEQQLALAHAPGLVSKRLEVFLALDRRFASFVSQSREVILTQMRIAWWRDQFGKTGLDRPNGDPIMDSLTQHWSGEERALIALADGWEALLAEPPLSDGAAIEFAEGRAACFSAMARLSGLDMAQEAAARLGEAWAFGDLASKISDDDERQFVLEIAMDHKVELKALPYKLRSLSILGSLGRRAIMRSGGPLIADRSDLVHVMRLGMFGR